MAASHYMGKALDDYTVEDLMKMKRKELMELFLKLDAPSMDEMHGEYRAALLDNGHALARLTSWVYLYFCYGTWQHKAFEPLGPDKGHGYNTFITTEASVPENVYKAFFIRIFTLLKSLFRFRYTQRLARIMLNKTSMVSSVFDKKPSFQLSYRDYNSFFTNTMTDEVRKVNDHVYLGIGRLTIILGKFNPQPFALMGPPSPWTGPDIPYPNER